MGSTGHRYVIEWFGPFVTIEMRQAMSAAKSELLGHVFTFDQTYIQVRKGKEDTTFLSFFPDGFLILDEARIPMDEWYAKASERGVMFRV